MRLAGGDVAPYVLAASDVRSTSGERERSWCALNSSQLSTLASAPRAWRSGDCSLDRPAPARVGMRVAVSLARVRGLGSGDAEDELVSTGLLRASRMRL